MAVPRVSQFSMHAEKPLRITAFPWKRQKSQMYARSVADSCCLVFRGRDGKVQTASQRNCCRDGAPHLADILPWSSHLAVCTSWDASPGTPPGKQDSWSWVFTIQTALGEHCMLSVLLSCYLKRRSKLQTDLILWVSTIAACGSPLWSRTLQVFLSHILLVQLWEKQLSSTLLLLKAMSTRCTPALY